MATLDARELVVVFDLDDTLYAERDYRRSGARAVARTIRRLFGPDVEPALVACAEDRDSDLLGEACRLAGLPDRVKETLLWVYRLHEPELALDPSTRSTLDALRGLGAHLAVLTDGRAVTQRLKLAALGLQDLPAYVSEEWGSEKPDALRFLRVMSDHPGRRCAYVGDNPDKDFVAPRALGWSTFQLRHRPHFVHRPTPGRGAPADVELGELSELLGFLASPGSSGAPA